ncbi:tyrosine-type recombinase/integrase [Paenibacillus bovis]|uniref:Integrase n=1 Tax=Paenibacillus bovis TaxID=1616788 RepID=A0A1X9T4I0_9BACL|nr:tyrosine-type recombinase/integrase [Paenibacillus bovis]ARR10779.1 hypothetical protein AR543_p0171 [Paenibacillus bovis]
MDNLISFPGTSPGPIAAPAHSDVRSREEWLQRLTKEMERRQRDSKTIRAYMGLWEQFIEFVEAKPGGEQGFYPLLMTETAVQEYFLYLREMRRSPSTMNKAKAALKMALSILAAEEFEAPLLKNPLQYVKIPTQPVSSPRELSDRQRYILKSLVEREGTPRGAAIFALGYHVGARISDVAHLRLDEVYNRVRTTELNLGYKNEKKRLVPISSQARNALQFYIYRQEPGCRSQSKFAETSPFVFVSQRAEQMTEAGIHHWFTTLKRSAPVDWYHEIEDVTFHDLRHDFAHRMRNDKGWSLEELAYYLGHTTKSGNLSIQTTVRYTMPTQEAFRKRMDQLD